MNSTIPSRAGGGYKLKSELARFSLRAAEPDPDRNLAWVNSVCVIFLLVGVVGSRATSISLKAPPPLEEPIPVIIQPVAPPVKPQELQADDKPEPDQPATPQMVAVTLETPAINFAVPTIGTLLVPNSVAVAPPVAPLRRAAAPVQKALPSSVASTGAGGDRPQPTYPKLAIQLGQQGAVTLLVTGDAAGRVVAASVQESSGFPLLDSSTLEFVKRHWILPRGDGPREYVATIKYRLE